ncbi:MAG: DMT family transporter [Magnetospirillum sp.]|nr:DMT family transporter [Magnetospirillum sp.]
MFTRAMPALFVLLWSTGFIGAKFGLPYAEPFTFLSIRFVLIIALLSVLGWAAKADWPKSPRQIGHLLVSGTLVHAAYLGGVFAAIHHGLSSGMAALLVGLQPLLTALVAGPLFGERITPRQWLGLVLGLVGVMLVLAARPNGLGFAGLSWVGVLFALVALAGITAGTLYQKRFGQGMDLRTGSAVQYVGALLVLGPAAYFSETMRVEWTLTFVLAMAWLVLVLSLGAITLLMILIRSGEAARVASLFYLVPPVTAAIAWALFGETLTMLGLAGMGLAALGVALVIKR